jgi:threonylcarbamoyladenosine tRNA methylthiotransferase MtaB
VLNDITELIGQGVKEFILTGIHLGGYGLDLNPPTDITGLIKAIELRALPARFRISSLDPDELTDELIEILSTAKTICPHLHLPVQSGDDRILGLMRRPYSVELFRKKVVALYKRVKDIAIGVDIMVGFPGEGKREFLNSFHLIEELPIAYMHIFPYSKRPGTPAASFASRADGKTVKERVRLLKELDRKKRRAFYSASVGTIREVVVESKRASARGAKLYGRTENYIPTLFEGGSELVGTLRQVEIVGATEDGVTGRIVDEEPSQTAKETDREATG